MRSLLLLLPLPPLLVSGCFLVDELHDDCGSSPGDGCTDEECVTDPADPDYGSCGGSLYECHGGEWVAVGYCEPWPVEVGGTWDLELTVDLDPCPAIAHRTELVLRADGFGWSSYTISTDDPLVTIEDSYVEGGFQTTTVHVVFLDDWGTVEAPRVDMNLSFDWDDHITGEASTSVDGCAYHLGVIGTRTPG